MGTSHHRPIGQKNLGLSELGLFNKIAESVFDELTELTATICDADVALISVIDAPNDRQVFKSALGLPAPWAEKKETPLSHSFCQHVVADDAPLIVDDATAHPVVCDNLAIRDLNVKAYLGVPIYGLEGQPIGALCAIASEPRAWNRGLVPRLNAVARCVSNEVQLRAALKNSRSTSQELAEMRSQDLRYHALRESVTLAFLTPDLPVEDRFRLILKTGSEAFGMERAAINKFEASHSTIIFSYSKDGKSYESNKRKNSNSLCGHMMRDQCNLSYADDRKAPVGALVDMTNTTPGSYIGAPLIFGGHLYGSIGFSHSDRRSQDWTENEYSILGIIAALVATNLTLLSEIERLRASEVALLSYVNQIRERGPAHSAVVA